jgi:hypothetical protein
MESITLPQRYYDPKHKGWGHAGWVFLHSIADSFPENPSLEERRHVEVFFTQCLPRLLPCSFCNAHLSEEVLKNAIDSSSGKNLSYWLYRIHNNVRKRTGEPEFTMEQCQKEQEWNRSINWAEVVKDLKFDCNKLCHHATAANTAGASASASEACATPEKNYDFRRVTLPDFLKIVGLAHKKYNLVLLVVSLIALFFLIISSVLFVKYRSLSRDVKRRQVSLSLDSIESYI